MTQFFSRNITKLAELADVAETTPVAGQALIYSGDAWTNGTATVAPQPTPSLQAVTNAGATTTDAVTVGSLTAGSIAAPITQAQVTGLTAALSSLQAAVAAVQSALTGLAPESSVSALQNALAALQSTVAAIPTTTPNLGQVLAAGSNANDTAINGVGSLGVIGQVTVGGTLNVAGGATLGGGVVVNKTDGTLVFQVNGTNDPFFASKVGFGADVTLSQDLYVNGAFRTISGITNNYNNPLYLYNINGRGVVIGDSATTQTTNVVDVALPTYMRSTLNVVGGATVGSLSAGGGILAAPTPGASRYVVQAYDPNADAGFFYAVDTTNGVVWKNICLNPIGANVLVGGYVDNGSGARLQVSGALSAAGASLTGNAVVGGSLDVVGGATVNGDVTASLYHFGTTGAYIECTDGATLIFHSAAGNNFTLVQDQS